ncbi:MAG TPA: hypothetical protein VLV78_06940 [Thermoanaerobaculia bacterium]|nr:hypothetical protein [Thermoanaerobaculia bacterium]
MSELYISRSRIERRKGPIREAFIVGEAQPVIFSVHGGIAKHYGVDAETLGETHAATIDYLIAAIAG